MSDPLKYQEGIVRILKEGKALGTAFLVERDLHPYLLTCTHVIQKVQPTRAKGSIISFARKGSPEPLNAKIEISQSLEEGDVTLLKIVDPDAVAGLQPFILGSPATTDFKYQTFGYPSVQSLNGDPASGRASRHDVTKSDNIGVNVYKLDDANDIRPGYSGAPLIDMDMRTVIGIVDSIIKVDANQRGQNVAYAVQIDENIATHFHLPFKSFEAPVPAPKPDTPVNELAWMGFNRTHQRNEIQKELSKSGGRSHFFLLKGPANQSHYNFIVSTKEDLKLKQKNQLPPGPIFVSPEIDLPHQSADMDRNLADFKATFSDTIGYDELGDGTWKLEELFRLPCFARNSILIIAIAVYNDRWNKHVTKGLQKIHEQLQLSVHKNKALFLYVSIKFPEKTGFLDFSAKIKAKTIRSEFKQMEAKNWVALPELSSVKKNRQDTQLWKNRYKLRHLSDLGVEEKIFKHDESELSMDVVEDRLRELLDS